MFSLPTTVTVSGTEYPVRADASAYRLHDFYDGYWKIDRKDFDKFNELTDSCDVFDLMEDEQ